MKDVQEQATSKQRAGILSHHYFQKHSLKQSLTFIFANDNIATWTEKLALDVRHDYFMGHLQDWLHLFCNLCICALMFHVFTLYCQLR